MRNSTAWWAAPYTTCDRSWESGAGSTMGSPGCARTARAPRPHSGVGVPECGRGARAVLAQPGDPIVDPAPLSQERSHVVYGAAHHAVEFLIARYGEARVLEVMRLMGTGLRFPAAFKEAIGLTDAEFASDFRRYVVWQGWRR